MNYGTIGAIIGDKWRNMSAFEKAPYLETAARDSERYAREKEVRISVTASRSSTFELRHKCL